MADKREAYAGDLGSDVLGRTIKVRTMRGEAIVDAVQHFLDRGKRKTTLWFANGSSTLVPDTELVEVLPVAPVVPLRNGAWVCPVCSATTNTLPELETHRAIHTPEGGDVA
jgi:hypothetical protein